MAGFTGLQIPLTVRRILTMAPALAILAIRMNPLSALVLSQVVLSFGIPFALIPLVLLTTRREIMGVHVNRRVTAMLAWACAGLISALNLLLLWQNLAT